MRGLEYDRRQIVIADLKDSLFHVGSESRKLIAILPSRHEVNLLDPNDNPLGFNQTFIDYPFLNAARRVATGQGIVYTPGDEFRLDWLGADGRLALSSRIRKRAGRVVPSMIAHYQRAMLGQYPKPGDEAYIRWLLGELPRPETHPFVDALFVTDNGAVWAREFAYPQPERRLWRIFASNGSYDGTISIPASWGLRQVTDGLLLISRTESSGHPVVELYRLVPAG
jgi:hypothetical protein